MADVFLIAWRRLEEVPPDEEARLWLFGVARRVLSNRMRAELRRTRLTERLRAEPAITTTVPIGSRRDIDAAGQALSRLREDQRELLGLIAWEGLTVVELARVLGCSKNAAKIPVHRARRRFAQELARIEADVKPPRPAGHARADRKTTASSIAEKP